jgi:hypothetical protein
MIGESKISMKGLLLLPACARMPLPGVIHPFGVMVNAQTGC